MRTKFFKIISVGVLTLALTVLTGGLANAVVTLNATSVTSDVALTLTGTTTSTWSLSGDGAALTINSGGAAALTLDSGTTGAVNLGTGAAAKTITIGNAASTLLDLNAISVDIDGGATGVTIDALDAGSINLGTSADAASDTSAINIGTSATARTITVGGGDASIFVINGRVASEAIGGTEIGLDSSYTYGEGLELRYGVDDWAGIAGSFKGYYFRTEANVESASYGVRGMEVYSVLDIDTGTAGIQSLTGLYSELLVKAPATSYTIAGYPNSIEANFSYEQATAGTTTITNGVAALVAKIQTANGLASYSNLDGVRIIGRDADAVRVMGDGLAIENDPVGSNATWTNAIAISAGAATGINITGAMTTADIALQNGETIANGTDNQFLFSAPGGANTVTINAADSDANAALVVRAGGTGALTLGNTANTSVTIAADGTTDGDLVLPLTSVSGAEMVDNTVTTTQLAAALTFAALDFVDLALVVQDTTANQGLRLPQAASATPSSPTSGEGYLAWNVAGNQLIAYDGSAWITALGNATAANTWTDNQIYTFVGDEDIAITSDLGAIANIINITATPNAADFAVQGIKIDQAASANANGLDAAIEIDNSDDSAAITAGVLFTSAGGAITTAVDASAAGVGTALAFGDNSIDGTYFDVAATTGAVTLTQQTVATSPLTFTGIDNGTAALLDINVSNVSGTLIDVDYVAETQTGDLTGLDLNLNTNVTAATDQDVTGVNIQTPALTATDTSVTTTYTGYNISAAGTLATTDGAVGAAVINWRGANITIPAITAETGDTVTAYGVLITAGTVTNGLGTETSIGVDVSDSDIVTALSIGANPILSTGTVTFNRADSGTVTLNALDDDANAALTISSGGTGILTLDAGGAGSIVIGSADVTAITLTTDGGAVTIGSAGTANGDGVRIGNARVTVNKPTAAVDCADADCTPTVTQILEAGIFFGTPTADHAFTLPAVQGASGLVQALPGTPAVGDVFSFVIANKAALASGFEIVLAATASPAGYTLGSLGTVGAATTTTFYCRVTGVTGNSETVTCY